METVHDHTLTVQSLTPQALRLLSKEIVSLRNEPLEGVRVVVDEEDLTAMEGWVQGPCKSKSGRHTSRYDRIITGVSILFWCG